MEIFLGAILLISILSLYICGEFEDIIENRFLAWSWFLISAVVVFSTLGVLMYVNIILQPFPVPNLCNCIGCK
ncbi:MAG: hypothetical protein NC253_12660 [Ruminococcus sp.]|nr:hypothetical protein [Ruminococcus sp.]MCM1382880.1 hypothetical protein [Muribaculaceae bacterium]MCM1480932.1 hypothetical protein [Muribaculaceae bacterium]